mmetsp:Transcript_9247/g.24422  ORF Transcript_9247/g.24422 Transcript_9247/m.24422 type:complete len:371 (-) Transcript_9247:942-2054(-)
MLEHEEQIVTDDLEAVVMAQWSKKTQQIIDAWALGVIGSPATSIESNSPTASSAGSSRKSSKKLLRVQYTADCFELVDRMRNSICVKDRFVAMRKQRNTVLACDVVNWLVANNEADSVSQAVDIGALLMEYGHMYALDEEKEGFDAQSSPRFANAAIPLRFAVDERQASLGRGTEKFDDFRKAFKASVRPHTTRFGMLTFEVFSGSEATSWVVNSGYARNRGLAVPLCQVLMDDGVIARAFGRDTRFQDSSKVMFRFIVPEFKPDAVQRHGKKLASSPSVSSLSLSLRRVDSSKSCSFAVYMEDCISPGTSSLSPERKSRSSTRIATPLNDTAPFSGAEFTMKSRRKSNNCATLYKTPRDAISSSQLLKK